MRNVRNVGARLSWLSAGALALLLVCSCGCVDADRQRVKATTQANYDPVTGKLTEITYDKNKNGRIDTWTKMNGSVPVSSMLDTDEDGKIDRWEEYGPNGLLVKAMWERPKPPTATSRAMTGVPDSVAFMGPDGKPERVEYSELSEVTNKVTVVRRMFYEGDRMVRAEEDTEGFGRMNRFERYDDVGNLASVELDTSGDGVPDKRFVYDANSSLVSVETQPDGKGGYLKKAIPGKGK